MGIRASEPIVWIIDNEHWPRACLRAELIERGFEAVGFAELPRALADLQYAYTSKPSLMVLELRHQPIKAEELLVIKQTGIPIIAFSGAAEWRDPLVQEFPWTAILHRPFTIGEVADLVQKMIRLDEPPGTKK